uniref:DB domain-containing protein n=1 Tax=Steinernema glaseri TaxID=37863 RepID=A0A1I7ZY48_9BILA
MFPTASLLLLIAVLSSSISLIESCFSAGVCTSCAPPQPVCRGGCGGGYSCGQYGCYRARAASSKTVQLSRRKEDFSDEGSTGSEEFDDLPSHDLPEIVDEPEPEPKTPDEKFLACCQERRLPDECLNKCSFGSYTREALQAMYFRIDRCPMQAAAELQYCAAQGKNHMECCARNGVASTLVGEKCLTFCDQESGHVTPLDFTYLACFDKFDSMKGCFWFDIRGDEHRQRPQLLRPQARRFDV